MNPLPLIAAAAGALVGIALAKDKIRGLMRQAEVDGRSYSVFSEGHGEFVVVSNDDPNVWIAFNDAGENGGGSGSDAKKNQLREDMQHFPAGLFR